MRRSSIHALISRVPSSVYALKDFVVRVNSRSNYQKLGAIFAALLISLGGCNNAQNRVVEEVFERLCTIEPSANITIQNGEGAVLVYGSNANEMRVHAAKKAYSRARLAQIAVNVDVKPGSVSIATKFPPKPKWGLFDRSGTVDYTIVVPATANISGLDLDAGEILVDGIRGQMTRARLGDGRMFTRNCFTALELTLRRGNLIISYDWWEPSKFSAEVQIGQGNALAHLPTDAAFHLLAKTAQGKILNDFETSAVEASATAAGVNIDTLVNGGGEATVKIRVMKGDIKIAETNP